MWLFCENIHVRTITNIKKRVFELFYMHILRMHKADCMQFFINLVIHGSLMDKLFNE